MIPEVTPGRRPLLIVRPEPGAAATLKAAQELGLDAQAIPIFRIEPVAWEPVARETVDAVLLGSANAVRHAGAGLERLRGLPAYCVGQTTAAMAEAAGFTIAAVGTGGLQPVLGTLDPAHRRLLRLTGVTHLPLALPPGITVLTRTVYDARALPLADALRAALREPVVVMLHSGEAATHFAALCDDAGVERARIALATIGPRVTQCAGQGWSSVETAPQPSDAALLALAREMCQDAGRGAENP